MVTTQTDVVDRALDRIIFQDKNLPNWENLLRGLAGEAQDIENEFANLRGALDPTTTTGDALDKLGKRVGESRQSRADDLYRLFIQARLAVNRSHGLAENMYSAARALFDSTYNLVLTDYVPKSFILSVTGAAAPADAADRLSVILEARPLGTNGQAVYNLSPDAEAFVLTDDADAPETSAAQGFADLGSNLLPDSNNLDQWDGYDVDEVSTAPLVTDAFGTNTAWLISTDGIITKTGKNTHSATLGAATTHTFSMYVAPNAADWCLLQINDSVFADVARCYFDITNGVVGTGSDPDFVSASMTLIANGFYRCEVQFTGAAADFNFTIQAAEADGDVSFTTEIDAIYCHAAQVVEGTDPGTYLDTDATPVSEPIAIGGGKLAGVVANAS